MSRDDDVVATVPCPIPECKAKKGQPCRYVRVPRPLSPTTTNWSRFRKNGKPTTHPHQRRRDAYYRFVWNRDVRPILPPRTEHEKVVAAERAAQVDEWTRMREWLRAHWHIFFQEMQWKDTEP
jgi:hypothetical protein